MREILSARIVLLKEGKLRGIGKKIIREIQLPQRLAHFESTHEYACYLVLLQVKKLKLGKAVHPKASNSASAQTQLSD